MAKLSEESPSTQVVGRLLRRTIPLTVVAIFIEQSSIVILNLGLRASMQPVKMSKN